MVVGYLPYLPMLLHRLESVHLISRKLLIFLVALVVLAIILEIWVVNRLSTYGEKMTHIENASRILKMENEILRNKIDSFSSLDYIQKKAESLNMVPARSILYLQD